MRVWGLLAFAFAVSVLSQRVEAAPGGAASCDLLAPVGPSSNNIARLTEVHSLYSLLNVDPAQNLAYKHPSIVMRAAQRLYHLTRIGETRPTRDANYRIRPQIIYPAFSDFLPQAGGRGIVGQYELIQEIVEYIRGLAEGRRTSHIPQLTGPAGTGKTEFLTVLAKLDAYLSANDPDFYRYTYRFRNLKSIESLKYLPESFRTLPGSPYLLLPESLRRAVVQMANSRVEGLIGLQALPFEVIDDQTQHIINEIYKHKMHETGNSQPDDLTQVAWLNEYVDIVRHYVDPQAPPAIIRYQGANPREHNLFFSQNAILSAVYQGTPLEHSYSGEVLRAYGGAGGLDEFWRNIEELRNTFLEVAQSGVVANSGVAVQVDAVWFMASNDESIASARQAGGSNAQFDRARVIPARQPLHPHHTAKTALYTLGTANFEQKALVEADADGSLETGFTPLVLGAVYPNGDEQGALPGADGRFAIRYAARSTDARNVLIAPHSLLFMGLFAGATRMVTDVGLIRKELPALSLLTQNTQFLTDVKLRLETLLGIAKPANSILVDLRSVERAMREGQTGITARTVEEWLNRAISAAAQMPGHTLTPWILNAVFKEMVENPDIAKIPANQSKAQWYQLMKLVQYELLLPMMRQDVLAILNAETGKTEQIYDELRHEIDAIQNAPTAETWAHPLGRNIPINRGRLSEIIATYRRVNGVAFSLNELPLFHSTAGLDASARFEPLMRAISEWVFSAALSDAVLGQYDDYFAGRAVSQEIRTKGDAAKRSLARYGYNEAAFRDTLAFVIDTQNEIRADQQRRQQP